MVLVGLSRIKWWVTGALIVALTSLAYAKPSFVGHGGHGFFGGASSFQGASFGGPVHGNAAPRANISRGMATPHYSGRYARSEAPRSRGNASDRNSVNNTFAGRVGGSNASGYTAQRLTLPADVYRNRPAAQYGGTQYAGAITPISTESRNAPRPPANAQSAHVGSIRDDVTRYNEERGASRPIPRPPGDSSRIPSPSPYRN
ncbi:MULTISPECIES: hypothetical protein [Paraburkholderia]|jgi:hypothetical protein|uniref:hypothetical protein n=1 Tax=Paraburkholderia TaxID=1822464 RepID=UPI00071EF2A9|nr:MULTISPECIES: hypothetical protein [Paraburkholderia]ALP61298.1 hypothetical protein AN416_00975 [Paraburkholderia caribensis]AUT50578.1 hypothetical protein C2L66_01065 [Paraburkholderia caribensis]CAG9195740.1 conserved hypothetical protein [Paraburkholderia caribensis]